MVPRLEVLPKFHALQATLGVQGANEQLSNVYNMVWQQNLKVVEERLICIEESLHNATSKGNTVHEAASKRSHTVIREPEASHQDETPRSPSYQRS